MVGRTGATARVARVALPVGADAPIGCDALVLGDRAVRAHALATVAPAAARAASVATAIVPALLAVAFGRATGDANPVGAGLLAPASAARVAAAVAPASLP